MSLALQFSLGLIVYVMQDFYICACSTPRGLDEVKAQLRVLGFIILTPWSDVTETRTRDESYYLLSDTM